MAIRIPFAGKYVYFGPETGLHTQGEARAETYDLTGPRYYDGMTCLPLPGMCATHPDYHTIINKQLSVTDCARRRGGSGYQLAGGCGFYGLLR